MSWNHYDGGSPPLGTGAATAVGQVTSIMSSMHTAASTFAAQASSTMTALGNLQLPALPPAPDLSALQPTTVDINWPAPVALAVDGLVVPSTAVPSPASSTIDTSYTVTVPTFTPHISDIHIPEAPGAIDTSGMPVRPAINMDVTLPAAPTLATPVMDSLDAIVIPAFTMPVLPTFTDEAPVFSEAAPNVSMDWTEPTYASENLTQVLATIKRIFAGGTGLPPVIEQQMFDRARGRLDVTARKAVAEAFDTFANKGFTVPPGMLVEQVNAVQQQNQLAANDQERDIRVLVAQTEIENMKFAVQQGLAAENVLFNIFNNALNRAFEMAKLTVESQLQLYSAKISVFNALTSAYQTRGQIFKFRLDAELAQLDAYRVQLEGQKVVSEINTQRVQAFNARVQAMLAQVEVYKAQMQGAQTQAEVIRTQIEGFKADVGAYAEKVGAQKVTFDVYRTQVDAEMAKVGIIDAEARVFQSLLGAEEIKANVKMKGIQADIEKMQADTSRFAALVDRSKADVAAHMARVEAQARVAGLSIQNMSAQADANRAKAEAAIRVNEQVLQTNLARASTAVKLYEVNLSATLQQADLKARSLQAAGQMAATLAGGAMAAQHVQASISANASDSTSLQFGYNQSAQESWQYTPTSTNS